ncbi:hypothetical protein CN212_35150 [Sinorhizobium meliloti]|nr:hypothetical protein CN212_35150 [Sinorhizobium meliloti]
MLAATSLWPKCCLRKNAAIEIYADLIDSEKRRDAVVRADSDEAAPLFRDDCAPGFRDDLAPCLVGSAGDDCCQFIQARCQALRGRFRRRLSPLNSMRWALWTNLSSMASA